MTLLLRTTTILVLLYALTWTSLLRIEPAQTLTQSVTTLGIPVQTDDGLDPINLIFTGYSPPGGSPQTWWAGATQPIVPDPRQSTASPTITLWNILTQLDCHVSDPGNTSASGTWDTARRLENGA